MEGSVVCRNGGDCMQGIQQIFSVRFHFDCSFSPSSPFHILPLYPFIFVFLFVCFVFVCFLSLHNKSLRKAFQFKWMKNEGKNVLCMSMVGEVAGLAGGRDQSGDGKQSVNEALEPSLKKQSGRPEKSKAVQPEFVATPKDTWECSREQVLLTKILILKTSAYTIYYQKSPCFN